METNPTEPIRMSYNILKTNPSSVSKDQMLNQIHSHLSIPPIYEEISLACIKPDSKILYNLIKKQDQIIESGEFDPELYFRSFPHILLDDEEIEQSLQWWQFDQGEVNIEFEEMEMMSMSAMTTDYAQSSYNDNLAFSQHRMSQQNISQSQMSQQSISQNQMSQQSISQNQMSQKSILQNQMSQQNINNDSIRSVLINKRISQRSNISNQLKKRMSDNSQVRHDSLSLQNSSATQDTFKNNYGLRTGSISISRLHDDSEQASCQEVPKIAGTHIGICNLTFSDHSIENTNIDPDKVLTNKLPSQYSSKSIPSSVEINPKHDSNSKYSRSTTSKRSLKIAPSGFNQSALHNNLTERNNNVHTYCHIYQTEDGQFVEVDEKDGTYTIINELPEDYYIEPDNNHKYISNGYKGTPCIQPIVDEDCEEMSCTSVMESPKKIINKESPASNSDYFKSQFDLVNSEQMSIESELKPKISRQNLEQRVSVIPIAKNLCYVIKDDSNKMSQFCLDKRKQNHSIMSSTGDTDLYSSQPRLSGQNRLYTLNVKNRHQSTVDNRLQSVGIHRKISSCQQNEPKISTKLFHSQFNGQYLAPLNQFEDSYNSANFPETDKDTKYTLNQSDSESDDNIEKVQANTSNVKDIPSADQGQFVNILVSQKEKQKPNFPKRKTVNIQSEVIEENDGESHISGKSSVIPSDNSIHNCHNSIENLTTTRKSLPNFKMINVEKIQEDNFARNSIKRQTGKNKHNVKDLDLDHFSNEKKIIPIFKFENNCRNNNIKPSLNYVYNTKATFSELCFDISPFKDNSTSNNLGYNFQPNLTNTYNIQAIADLALMQFSFLKVNGLAEQYSTKGPKCLIKFPNIEFESFENDLEDNSDVFVTNRSWGSDFLKVENTIDGETSRNYNYEGKREDCNSYYSNTDGVILTGRSDGKMTDFEGFHTARTNILIFSKNAVLTDNWDEEREIPASEINIDSLQNYCLKNTLLKHSSFLTQKIMGVPHYDKYNITNVFNNNIDASFSQVCIEDQYFENQNKIAPSSAVDMNVFCTKNLTNELEHIQEVEQKSKESEKCNSICKQHTNSLWSVKIDIDQNQERQQMDNSILLDLPQKQRPSTKQIPRARSQKPPTIALINKSNGFEIQDQKKDNKHEKSIVKLYNNKTRNSSINNSSIFNTRSSSVPKSKFMATKKSNKPMNISIDGKEIKSNTNSNVKQKSVDKNKRTEAKQKETDLNINLLQQNPKNASNPQKNCQSIKSKLNTYSTGKGNKPHAANVKTKTSEKIEFSTKALKNSINERLNTPNTSKQDPRDESLERYKEKMVDSISNIYKRPCITNSPIFNKEYQCINQTTMERVKKPKPDHASSFAKSNFNQTINKGCSKKYYTAKKDLSSFIGNKLDVLSINIKTLIDQRSTENTFSAKNSSNHILQLQEQKQFFESMTNEENDYNDNKGGHNYLYRSECAEDPVRNSSQENQSDRIKNLKQKSYKNPKRNFIAENVTKAKKLQTKNNPTERRTNYSTVKSNIVSLGGSRETSRSSLEEQRLQSKRNLNCELTHIAGKADKPYQKTSKLITNNIDCGWLQDKDLSNTPNIKIDLGEEYDQKPIVIINQTSCERRINSRLDDKAMIKLSNQKSSGKTGSRFGSNERASVSTLKNSRNEMLDSKDRSRGKVKNSNLKIGSNKNKIDRK